MLKGMFSGILNAITETTPDKEFFDKLPKSPRHTPDLFMLEQQQTVLLFEYGNLMKGMPGHNRMLPFQMKAPAFTIEKFALVKKRLGNGTFPLALRLGLLNTIQNPKLQQITLPNAKIAGEVYVVPATHIPVLDNYRENGVSFIRKRVNLVLPQIGDDGEPARVSAYTYIANKKTWEKPVAWDMTFYRREGGRDFGQCNTFHDYKRPWISQYHYFDHSDLERVPERQFLHYRNSEMQRAVQMIDDEFRKKEEIVEPKKENPARDYVYIS